MAGLSMLLMMRLVANYLRYHCHHLCHFLNTVNLEVPYSTVLVLWILVCAVFLNNTKLFTAAIYSKSFGPLLGFSTTGQILVCPIYISHKVITVNYFWLHFSPFQMFLLSPQSLLHVVLK